MYYENDLGICKCWQRFSAITARLLLQFSNTMTWFEYVTFTLVFLGFLYSRHTLSKKTYQWRCCHRSSNTCGFFIGICQLGDSPQTKNIFHYVFSKSILASLHFFVLLHWFNPKFFVCATCVFIKVVT